MATPVKKWPHHAEWSRMDCIALAQTGRQTLLKVIDRTQDPIILRAIARAADNFREIESKLNSVKEKS